MSPQISVENFLPTQTHLPVACVDVGGTKVAVTVIDGKGQRSRVLEPTVKTGKRDALAQQIIRMVTECSGLGDLAASELSAVGVSSCGPFVLVDGCVELAAPNICGGMSGGRHDLPNRWETAPLEAPLRKLFRSVRVENDGIGALEAERRWGALNVNGKPLAHCAYVTWSTGIGVGLCVDGRILRGKNGNAGHAGHLYVSDAENALCGCGNLGDVESLIGGNAMARRFAHLGFTDFSKFFEAYYAGDPEATIILEDFCRVMGRTLYNLIVTLDLQRISIGGSVFWHHRELLLPKLKSHVQGKLSALTDGCELVPAGLGEQVGDWGAYALVA